MEQRACGASGLTLPVLGVGAWSFGGGAYWGAGNAAEEAALVARALDLGCVYFDTAAMYNDGASERALGKALGSRRAEALIGTKVLPTHARPADLRAQCEASLRRLGADVIDLYMIHWPLCAPALRAFGADDALLRRPPGIGEALAEMEALRREGKIRHIGVSNFGPRQLEEALAAGVPIAVNQVAYNLLARAVEFEILPFCRRRGIGVMAYMPLMQGLLTGAYAGFDALPPQRTRTRHFAGTRPGARHGGPGHEGEVRRTLDGLRALADRERCPMGRLALAWLAARPGVTCVLAGARTRAQLEANAAGIEPFLPPALWRELDAATRPLKEAMGPNADLWQAGADRRIV